MGEEQKKKEWEAALAGYLQYLTFERGLSANSVYSYKLDIELFAKYISAEAGVYPPVAEPFHIEAFMAWLFDRKTKKSSQARILSGLKSFYNYLLYTGKLESAPTELLDAPKIGRKLPDTLSVQEIDAILSAVDLSHPQGHRNRAMLEMMYSCGLRVSEVVSLRLSDLFFDDGYIRVTGKGDKQRLVPFSSEVRKCVELYLGQRALSEPSTSSREVLFLNRRGGAMSRVMVFNVMKQAVAEAGVTKNVSPHTFRHSFATHLLEGGANIRQIQEMLGHSSILTTEIYTHLDRSHLKKSMEEHHPLR